MFNVLLIEPDPAVRICVEKTLQPGIFRVVTARSKGDALDSAWRGSFDLVIMGMFNPPEDSMEILDTIYISEPNLPVLVIIPEEEHGPVMTGFTENRISAIRKPVDSDRLLVEISLLMEQSLNPDNLLQPTA